MEILITDWSILKGFVDSRQLSIQWFQIGNKYHLYATDNVLYLNCQLFISNPASEDQADFEDHYKANGNKPVAIQILPFSAKSLPNGKNLFKRFMGIKQDLEAGTNTFTWTQSNFSWTKFLALEVIGAEIGDTCDLYILDTPTGTFSGYPNTPLNQFAFSANVAPNYYRHASEYDADLYQNLQIKFIYHSVSSKTIGINFDMNEVK